jgi:hypothetical protein
MSHRQVVQYTEQITNKQPTDQPQNWGPRVTLRAILFPSGLAAIPACETHRLTLHTDA